MDDKEVVTSGDNQDDASSTTDKQNTSNDDVSQRDVVAYETHRKLLGEKKKLQEKYQSLEQRLAEIEENKLKEKEDYKGLYENTKEELGKLHIELSQKKEEEIASRKLSAFLEILPGQVDKKYWGHVDLDKILLDPETGEIDQMSVTKVAKTFEQTYPEIIIKNGSVNLPNQSPKGNQGQTITYSEWLKLPLKEMEKWPRGQIIN